LLFSEQAKQPNIIALRQAKTTVVSQNVIGLALVFYIYSFAVSILLSIHYACFCSLQGDSIVLLRLVKN
jgi:hypothetical protein